MGKYWVLAVVYMDFCGLLAAACADRTIRFYDIKATNYTEPFNVIGEFDGIPMCMEYYYKGNGIEYLIVGDDLGICHVYKMEFGWHACIWNIDETKKREERSSKTKTKP